MPSIYEELHATALKAQPQFPQRQPTESNNDYLGRLTQAISGSTKEDFEVMSQPAQDWFDAAAESLNEHQDVNLPPGYESGNGAQQPNAPAPANRPATMRPGAPPAAAPPAAQPAPELAPQVQPAQPAVAQPHQPAPAAQQPAPAALDPSGGVRAGQTVNPETANQAAAAAPAAPAAAPAAPVTPRRGRPAGSTNASTRTTSAADAGNGQPQGIVSKRIRQLVIADQSIGVNDIIEKLKAEDLPDMAERRSTVSTLRYDTLTTLNLAKEAGWQPR
jgi:hypothetical protein